MVSPKLSAYIRTNIYGFNSKHKNDKTFNLGRYRVI